MNSDYLDMLKKSAARLREVAQRYRSAKGLSEEAWQRAGRESCAGAILFDVVVDRVAGPLTEAEADVADKLAFHAGFDWKMMLNPEGQRKVRQELAAEARRLAAVPKLQLELGAA